MTAPRPAMPIRWALTFAVVLALACWSGGYLAGHLTADAKRESLVRYVIDGREIKVHGDMPVWSVRWLESYGQVQMVQVENADDKDRLVAWLGRAR